MAAPKNLEDIIGEMGRDENTGSLITRHTKELAFLLDTVRSYCVVYNRLCFRSRLGNRTWLLYKCCWSQELSLTMISTLGDWVTDNES